MTLDVPILETPRLVLRGFNEKTDFETLAEMLADPETAEYIGGVTERAAAWRRFAAMVGHWVIRGYGFFAVEEKSSTSFVGMVGPHFPEGWPAPEVGWVIHRSRWGSGYAVEAAIAAMDFAFDNLAWDQAIHCIDTGNTKSQRVAEKLGSRLTSHVESLPPYGIPVDIYSQTATEWRRRSSPRT